MAAAILTIAFSVVLTAVSGYVYFRGEAIAAKRYERHGGKPYGPQEKALALLTFVIGVIASIAFILLALLK